MRVIRPNKTDVVTREDFERIADALAHVEVAVYDLWRAISGKVLVRWMDPLCTSGEALRFFMKLRSDLDADWYAMGHNAAAPSSPFSGASPFYGSRWEALCEKHGAVWEKPKAGGTQ